MADQIPTLRWGFTTAGLISSWFIEDLLVERSDAKARHVIQAVGASSLEKAEQFVKRFSLSNTSSYGSYEEVYEDPNVDIVHVGTPHSFHKNDCLRAINAGKHVLCEKAFTLTASEAQEVFAAAKTKGVFVMEAMWTRFTPLVQALQVTLHQDRVIGDIYRVFCDAGFYVDTDALGMDSRMKNPALGAGSLLDLGVYSLTWGLIALDPTMKAIPKVTGAQTLVAGVDVSSTVVLDFPESKQQGILTSTTLSTTHGIFCRIHGSKGYIDVDGIAAPAPASFTIHLNDASAEEHKASGGGSSSTHDFSNHPGRGFFWQADSVALDIIAGRTESKIMPWDETIRVLEITDEVRRQGGAIFQQDATDDV